VHKAVSEDIQTQTQYKLIRRRVTAPPPVSSPNKYFSATFLSLRLLLLKEKLGSSFKRVIISIMYCSLTN
jgi:hypothetical protein